MVYVVVASSSMGLRADLGFLAGGLALQALRAGRGSLVLDREGLVGCTIDDAVNEVLELDCL